MMTKTESEKKYSLSVCMCMRMCMHESFDLFNIEDLNVTSKK